MGIWATTGNFGNISGYVLAHICSDVKGLSWEWTYIISGSLVGVFGLLLLFLLVPHPSHVGIAVNEFAEEEAKEPEMLRHESQLLHGTNINEEN